jgi:uncharacterized Rmd1/YagE family protein
MADSPQRDIELETAFTPVTTDLDKWEVRADYFQSPIDLEIVQSHGLPLKVMAGDPLVLSGPKNAHVVVLRFGAVVFWRCDPAVREQVLETIQRVLEMKPPSSEVRDTLLVRLGQPEERVNFRDIWLRNLTLEHIKIISEAVGQSVALKHCELSVTQALKNTSPIVQALEARGELKPSEKSILKTVGFTLAVREAVLAKISLFDDPAEAWQSERLSRLRNLLYDHFDIKKRLVGLHEKVTFLSDLNLMLMTLLQNRTSHRLEWIVVLLIVIEVIFSIVQYFAPFH